MPSFATPCSRERDERAAKSAAHEQELVELRRAFDQKHETLQASLKARGEENDELRQGLERERADSAAKMAAHEAELRRLRLAFDGERVGLQAKLKARATNSRRFASLPGASTKP